MADRDRRAHAAAETLPGMKGSYAAVEASGEAVVDAWIAALVTFLLGEDRSGHTTGRAIAADEGFAGAGLTTRAG